MRLQSCIAPVLSALAAFGPAWGQAWHNGVAKVIPHKEYSIVPGTAFVVAIRGETAFLITAAHVLKGDPEPEIEFVADSSQPYKARIYRKAGNGDRDMAILSVAKPPGGIGVVPRNPTGPVRGASVQVGGYPTETGSLFVPMQGTATTNGLELVLSPHTPSGYSGGPVLSGDGAIGMVFGALGNFGGAVSGDAVELFLRNHGIAWGARETEAPKPPVRRTGDLRDGADGLKYVWIGAGKFTMGCSPRDNECFDNEKPAHEVEITRGFWIGQTEVTQAAWRRVMKTEPSRYKGDQLPVESMTWEEAREYCGKVGGRLPTEGEWEYAARAGSTSARYGEVDGVAWFGDNSGKKGIDSAALWRQEPDASKYAAKVTENGNQTKPVGGKQPNAWGLYDVLGNVWEWTAAWYDEKYYEQKVAKDPTGPSSGQYRILRGGSWYVVPLYVRVSVRYWVEPTNRYINTGVRCAGEFR